MLNHRKRQTKKFGVTHKLDIFSVDFTQRWLRISETINHAKILGLQKHNFKDSVILVFNRKKCNFKYYTVTKPKNTPLNDKVFENIFFRS